MAALLVFVRILAEQISILGALITTAPATKRFQLKAEKNAEMQEIKPLITSPTILEPAGKSNVFCKFGLLAMDRMGFLIGTGASKNLR
jgi:hypothetical protein